MTANQHYQKFMRAKIQGAIAEARAASMLTHQAVKGAVLEILISKLFRPLLPSDLGVGTGQLIDQQGRISNQVDIILYDRSILPPALYDDHMGLFPIEAVLYTIEVKTTLTRSDLLQAHMAAQKIFEFEYISGLQSPNGPAYQHSIEKAKSVVFALSSDVRMGEAVRYADVYSKRKELAYLAAICVAEKEYVFQATGHWGVVNPAGPCDEILSFLGGVMNTYKAVAASRYQPLLGHYIIPNTAPKQGPLIRDWDTVAMRCTSCQRNTDVDLRIETMGDVTINGPISVDSPSCDVCGGVLQAPPASYKFRHGYLCSITEL